MKTFKLLQILFFIGLSISLVKSTRFADEMSEQPKDVIRCPEIRSQACTKEYIPHCAWLDPRINCVAKKYPCAKNAANACLACLVKDSVSFSKGECPPNHVMYEPKQEKKEIDDLKENFKFFICNEESKKAEMCPMYFLPMCGWFDENSNAICDQKPCAVNASNECEACKITETIKYSKGHCPEKHLVKEEK